MASCALFDKRVPTAAEALGSIPDGATVMIGGFGEVGCPSELVHALIGQGARDLTVVSAQAGSAAMDALIGAGRVARLICSFPRTSRPGAFSTRYLSGAIELDLVPQGTLAERIRAGGSGIPAFYTPVGAGTLLGAGKEVRDFEGRECLLERALRADVALVRAEFADACGNLTFSKAARNFAPIMCAAADRCIVQAHRVLSAGAIEPEHVVTPGIFVDAVVEIAASRAGGIPTGRQGGEP